MIINKQIQNGVICSILKEEKNATLEVFNSLKIVRYINRFDKPCFRVYNGDSLKPIAASFFRDESDRGVKINQLKNDFSSSSFGAVISETISGALIWRDKIRGVLNGKLPDGFTASSRNLDDLVYILNDYSNLLNP